MVFFRVSSLDVPRQRSFVTVFSHLGVSSGVGIVLILGRIAWARLAVDGLLQDIILVMMAD